MSELDYFKKNPRLYNAITEVEKRITSADWDVAVQKMRTAAQILVGEFYYLYSADNIKPDSLYEQLNALKEADLIMPESAEALQEIRFKGNKVSHENVTLYSSEVIKLYESLITEMILFVDKYSKAPDPNGFIKLKNTVRNR